MKITKMKFILAFALISLAVSIKVSKVSVLESEKQILYTPTYYTPAYYTPAYYYTPLTYSSYWDPFFYYPYYYWDYPYVSYWFRKEGSEDEPKKEMTLDDATKEMKKLKKIVFGDENFSTTDIRKGKRYESTWITEQLKITRALEIEDIFNLMDKGSQKRRISDTTIESSKDTLKDTSKDTSTDTSKVTKSQENKTTEHPKNKENENKKTTSTTETKTNVQSEDIKTEVINEEKA